MSGKVSFMFDHCAIVSVLRSQYTVNQWHDVMNQPCCEYDGDFMGFLNVYEPISHAIPTNMTVIDFGCYCAFQAALFRNHKQYIGVDTCELKRFSVENTIHHVRSIQDFIKEHPETLSGKYFAICSYVPDANAVELVRKSYENCFTYYPSNIFG